MKKFRFTALLLCLAVLCCALLALAACNDSGSSGQSGSTGEEDPPAEKTVSVADVYDANVNEDGLAADITLAKQQKILSSIAGAENVNYLTDRTAIVEMADGTSHLFDITAAFSAEDKSFLENIADAIYAAANLDPDATITEAQEQATAQALKAAARQFAADAEQIIQNVSVDFVQLPQVDQSVELRENISEFAGFEQVVFSPMTESMAFTSEGNLESENCTMSYAFGINLDSSITAFVVTYADNGETAQEKIDNLANPGAAIISEVGTFPAGVDFSSQLPQLVQARESIKFEDAFDQVFGGFNYIDFEDNLQPLSEKVFSTTSDVHLVFAGTEGEFVLYADGLRSNGARCLLKGVYSGTQLEQIQQYQQISNDIAASEGLSAYVRELVGCSEEISAEEQDQVMAQMEAFLAVLQGVQQSFNQLQRTDFDTERSITNTSTNINFADFAKQFIPDGAQPVFCYVGSLAGRVIDTTYFNTGYRNGTNIQIGYIDENGNLVKKSLQVVVPQYTNSTNESLYNSMIGEKNIDYKIIGQDVEIIQNPILTGATSGIESEAEVEATR